MPQVDFTLEDVKRVIDERLEVRLDERFAAEREHTRTMIQEGVKEGTDHMVEQFNSFINDNFDPTMKRFDQRLDAIEDHQDQTDINVASLKTDVRQHFEFLPH